MRKTKKGTTVTGVTIPNDILEAVQKQANKEQRSLSNMISVTLAEKFCNDTRTVHNSK